MRRKHSLIRHCLSITLILLFAQNIFASDVIPPKPAGYFNDYAGIVDSQTALNLNEKLAQFERDTSSQVVVAIYKTMQSESSIDEYAVYVARSWQIGQKGKSNGVLLLIFTQDRKMTIQTGYGQEGALTDIQSKQIIDNEIAPRFKQGDYAGGLTAGVNAIMAAVRGEYKGTGETHTESRDNSSGNWVFWIFVIIVLLILIFGKRGGSGYSSGGFGTGFLLGGFGGGFSGGGGGGGFSGFSGGGGSFGGGGASGGW